MTSGLAIRGYACRFRRVFRPEGPHAMVIQPGGFETAADVPVLFDHDRQLPIDMAPGALSVWQDNSGLAFELEVDSDIGSIAVNEVASGRRACVSVCFAPDRDSQFGIFDGARAEIVTRTPIEEISLLAYGACPGAVAWVAVNGEDKVAAWHRDDWLIWRAGYQARLIGNHPDPEVPPTAGIYAKACGGLRRQPVQPVVPASVNKALRLAGGNDFRRAGRREAAAAQPMKPTPAAGVLHAPIQGNGSRHPHEPASITPTAPAGP